MFRFLLGFAQLNPTYDYPPGGQRSFSLVVLSTTREKTYSLCDLCVLNERSEWAVYNT
jgi:hypothetical protein